MNVNWNYPTTVWIGENRIDDLSLICKELNISNPLFATDMKTLYQHSITGKLFL